MITVEHPAADRVRLVPVHPPEHQSPAVDAEPVTVDPYRPEAQA
jgi:hypothetical protein